MNDEHFPVVNSRKCKFLKKVIKMCCLSFAYMVHIYLAGLVMYFSIWFSIPVTRAMYFKCMIDVPQDLRGMWVEIFELDLNNDNGDFKVKITFKNLFLIFPSCKVTLLNKAVIIL